MKSFVIAAIAFVSLVVAGMQPPLWGTKPYPQEMHDSQNPLKYLSTNGPYVHRRSFGLSRETPNSCTVDQIVVLMRHGGRYPTGYQAKNINIAIDKLYHITDKQFSGDLDFLNRWTNPFTDRCDYAMETYSGPYTGRADAFLRGAEFRARYGHLLTQESKDHVVPFFASQSERVVETARLFGQGFFGYGYANISALNIISEDKSAGADTLAPSCWANDTVDMHQVQKAVQDLPMFNVAAGRFNSQNAGLNLTGLDVYTLMGAAGFELGTRPVSPWINAFTPDEWATFAYAEDALYYYKSGYDSSSDGSNNNVSNLHRRNGDRNSLAMGSNFVKAAIRMLQSEDTSQKLTINFSHHTSILPVIAAFGIVSPEKPLPLTHPIYHSKWHLSDIMPMGAHLVIERLQCNTTVVSPEGLYVRFIINEAVVPMEECQNGPGYSCPLAKWVDYYSEKALDYAEDCEVPKSLPQQLEFWWHANYTTELNYREGPVPCGTD
ncbi:acid phosphatase pho5 [Ascosphaera aggregata]|nr:acid phosphatase pho5 [Ascosphaera aggregata]